MRVPIYVQINTVKRVKTIVKWRNEDDTCIPQRTFIVTQLVVDDVKQLLAVMQSAVTLRAKGNLRLINVAQDQFSFITLFDNRLSLILSGTSESLSLSRTFSMSNEIKSRNIIVQIHSQFGGKKIFFTNFFFYLMLFVLDALNFHFV